MARFLRDEVGSYLVFMALLLPFLVGLAGLAAEAGFWLYYHRVVQSAADNAAFSVATAYAVNSAASSSDLNLQAKAIIANDYNLVDGTNGVSVIVNRPPTGACFAGTSQYVGAANATEVIVTKSQAPLLAKLYLTSNVNICGRAVALTSGGGDCVLATGTAGTAISATRNNLSINLTGCGLFSNSSASDAIALSGNNDTITAEHVGTVGGISTSGNSKTVVENSTVGDPPVTDPYAADAATWPTSPTSPASPTTSCAGCAAQASCGNGSGNGAGNTCPASLLPGSYAAKLILADGLVHSMSAGTYVFPAGLVINSATTRLSVPAGVTLIVGTVGGAIGTGLTNKGIISFSGSSSIAVLSGGWTNSGTTAFGGGNYIIGITGGGWTNSGTTTFGSGNYDITVAGGGWTDSGTGTTTFGNGNYTMAITGDWTNGGTITTGTGNYSVSVAGNWNISTNMTIGTGIYYVSGNLLDTATTVTGNHVTIVLSGNTSIISTTKNNSSLTLSAPLAGWNAGIAIWEPSSTATSPNANQLASGNNSTATITGVIYAPNAEVDYLGNSGSTPVCTQIIAKSVVFGGNSINLKGDCTSVPGLKIFGQIVALVE